MKRLNFLDFPASVAELDPFNISFDENLGLLSSPDLILLSLNRPLSFFEVYAIFIIINHI